MPRVMPQAVVETLHSQEVDRENVLEVVASLGGDSEVVAWIQTSYA